MLSEELQKKNWQMDHAPGDADLLIVLKAVKSVTLCYMYIDGDVTDLIILLCYLANLESHDLYFVLSQRR